MSVKQGPARRNKSQATDGTESIVEPRVKPMFYEGGWAKVAERVVLDSCAQTIGVAKSEVGVQTDMSLDPDEIVVTQQELLEGASEAE